MTDTTAWRPRLDLTWLESLGYEGLSSPQKHRLLAEAYNALELRVGGLLSARLPDHLIEQFRSIIDHPDAQISDSMSTRFLVEHVPDYRETVQSAYEELSAELRTIRTQFDEARRANDPLGASHETQSLPPLQDEAPAHKGALHQLETHSDASHSDETRSLGDEIR